MDPIVAPVPSVPQPKSKLPLILVVIILLVTVGILGVLAGKYLFGSKTPETTQPIVTSETTTTPTPTPDLTANWKTYTNTKYGYFLKYPSDWTINLGVTGITGDDANLETVYQIKLNSQKIPEEKLMIWVWAKKSFFKNIDQFSSNLEISKPNSDRMQIYSKEKTILGGVEALKYTRSQPGVGKVLDVTAINNDYEYTLNLDRPDTQPQNIPIFDQILSTFRFD